MTYIGTLLSERMAIFDLTAEDLEEKSFVDKDLIEMILNDQIPLEEIDDFDLDLMCSVLHCTPKFFSNPEVRSRDLLFSSSDTSARNVKAKIQDFMNDFAFLESERKRCL